MKGKYYELESIIKKSFGNSSCFCLLALKLKYPDFPLSENDFVETLLWLVAFGVGGWQLQNIKASLKK